MTSTATQLRPKPLLTIRPSSGWAALNLAETWHFRDLLMSLAGRDVRLRYKQTALGAAWVLLQPLLAAGIFTFVFGKVARMSSDGVPYFLFAYAGLLAWTAFSNTLTKSSACLIGNSQLVSKVYFPRIILPLSNVPSALIDFAIALAMMAVMMAVKRIVPGPAILLLPIWLALVLMLSAGLGLVASALTVTYRDVQYIMPVIVQMLLYASPVAYSVTAVPARLRPWYDLNPLSGLLEAFRWSLLGVPAPRPGVLLYSAAACIAVFLLSIVCFKNMERRFADVI